MIIPMVIMQLGIAISYWMNFANKPWGIHIHYWTGTAWYFYLILQPYLATRGKITLHRTNGIIGMFIAGGVCMTAISLLNRNIVNATTAGENPERFAPLEPWFFYGTNVMESVMMIAFGYAVIRSIIHRKELENHAWWLISTVFLILNPALGRGVFIAYAMANSDKMPTINLYVPAVLTQFLILAMLLLVSWKYGKLKHPATLLAAGVNIFVLFLEPIGRSGAVQAFMTAVIK